METPEGKRFNTVGPDSVSVGQGSRPISFHSRTKSLPPSPDSPPSLPCPGCAAPPSAGRNQSTGRLRLHGSANVSVVLRLLGESVELRVLSDSSTMTIAMMSQVFIDVFLNSLELFFIYAALIFDLINLPFWTIYRCFLGFSSRFFKFSSSSGFFLFNGLRI